MCIHTYTSTYTHTYMGRRGRAMRIQGPACTDEVSRRRGISAASRRARRSQALGVAPDRAFGQTRRSMAVVKGGYYAWPCPFFLPTRVAPRPQHAA